MKFFGTDRSNINDEFTCDGIEEHTALRRCHVTNKASDVATFSLPADRQSRAPQHSQQFDRAAIELLCEQTRVSILCWNQEWFVEEAKNIGGPWLVVAVQESIEVLEDVANTRQFHVAHFRVCINDVFNAVNT